MKKILLSIIALLVGQLLPFLGSGNEAVSLEKLSLPKILSQNKIVGLSYWDVGESPILCIVTDHVKKRDDISIPVRKLSFYLKRDDLLIKQYASETADNLYSISPLADGNLLTIWVSGSAFHINVFALVGKEIKLVLKEGSKSIPEIADVDNDGMGEILVSTGSVYQPNSNKIEPETTQIFKWDAKSYKLIKTVPWKKRLIL